MAKLSDGCKEHLEEALRVDDPKQKNYHIRQVLQACGVDDVPDGFVVKGLSRTSDSSSE